MSRLLHVIANPKLDDSSFSRQLATHFFKVRRLVRSDESIETLDLYLEDVPMVDAVTAERLTNPPEPGKGPMDDGGVPPSWALKASDRYTAQFLRADRIVITTALWNFGPPAILKAWIDLIVRIGETVAFTETGVRPLAPGKKMLLIGASGGVYSGDSPIREYQLLEPYLRALFRFLGVETFEAVWVEGTTYPDSKEFAASLRAAKKQLKALSETF